MTIVQGNLVRDHISRQFQTSGSLLFTDFWTWKLYGPEVSQSLPCTLQFFSKYMAISDFFKYIEDVDHFILDFLNRSDV